MSVFEVNTNQYTANYNCVIIPENGSSFREGKRLRFNIDKGSGFIDPENSFLRFDLNRSGNGAGGAVPEPTSGGHSLIRDLIINSGDGSNLEELLDYNVWVNKEINLSNDEGYKETRSNIEGCILGDDDDDETLSQKDIIESKYTKYDSNGATPLSRKLCLPLYGGLFKSGKVIPVSALNGLRLDLQLDDNVKRCMRATTELVKVLDAVAVDLSGANSAYVVISPNSVSVANVADIPYKVGDTIKVNEGADITISKIKSIEVAKPDTHPPYPQTTDHIIIELEDNLKNVNYTAPKVEWSDTNELSYEVSNPVLVVRKVVPNPNYVNSMMKKLEGKGLTFDIKSYTNIKNSISGDAQQSSTLINSFHSRALSLISVPQSQSTTSLVDNLLRGNNLNAINYVYNIKSKQVPSRRVNLSRYNLNASTNSVLDKHICNDVEHISETDKAWRNAGVVVRNLRNQQYNISYDRSLSNYGGSMDLRGANPQIQIQYPSGGISKLLNTYISHLRNITISPQEGIKVST